jgi:hypothetical protein
MIVLMLIFAFIGKFPWVLSPWVWGSVLVGGLLFDAYRGGVLRYLNFHRQHQHNPREAELLKASHGAAVLAICGLAAATVGAAAINRFIGELIAAPDDPWHFGPALAVAGLVLWGLLWFVSGAKRSLGYAGFRDSRFITRAILKVALGAAVWWVFRNPPPSWSPDVLEWIAWARASTYARLAIDAVIIWLVVTGLVRFLLVALPAAGNALRVVLKHRQKQGNNVMVPARRGWFRS